MPTQTANDAAERLRETMIRNQAQGHPAYTQELDEALAAERRATVERIRQTIMGPRGSQIRSTSAYVGLLAILDEEAAQS